MRLPSLKALPAFEAAGRLGSFQDAAREIGVTPGAVSKQIQNLEDHLGCRLFVRLHRQVQLTPAGRTYLEAVGGAFAQLDEATRAVAQLQVAEPLRIYSSTLFVQNWLTPRLARFRRIAPDLEVVLSVGAPREPLPVEADVGIRLGMKRVPGLVSHHLLDVDMVPVCSPAYIAATGRPRTPEDLEGHTLLGSRVRTDTWRVWLRAAGADFPITRMISFPDASGAYHAALKGAGIAMGYRDFAEMDLAAGNLVRLFDLSVRYGEAYYLVYPRTQAQADKVKKFRDWILEEMRLARAAKSPAATALG